MKMSMHRTQIYLDDDEVALLKRTASATGASRSELIRRAIRTTYGTDSAQRRLAALRASAGVWKDRDQTGDTYVRRIRDGLDPRLREAGLE